jgi:hypothetical protein
MIDFYSVSARSFEEDLDRIEKDGRKDLPDWHLAKGLLQKTKGLQQAREEEEDLRKCFAAILNTPEDRLLPQKSAQRR